MGRVRKRKIRAKGDTGTGYRSVSAVRRANYSATRSRRKKKSGLLEYMKSHYRVIAVASLAVVVVALVLILILGGKGTTPASAESDVSETVALDLNEYDEDVAYDYEGVDDSVLEGLAGTDEDLFTEEDVDYADALFAQTGKRIGVTVGDIDTDNDEMMLSTLEEAACAAEEAKQIYKVYYYNAGGDYNQQLQDVRSLIKNEVDVIVVGSTDGEGFEMVSYMADEAGIPLVAYNAPATAGYLVNVVADQTAWGETYGAFMAAQLSEGNIVQILGNEESEIDKERETAINAALAANEGVVTLGTKYAMWSATTAAEAITEYIGGSSPVDGVITEDGMAEAIIDAFITAGKLPKVMCGDTTVGFIKKWYALKNGGVDVTPEDADEDAEPVMFAAGAGEFVVCAQPAPTSISAAAFQIALKVAEGRVLKSEGGTYVYKMDTFITDENLAQYYEMVKDQPDAYMVTDHVADAAIELLFELQKEEQE